MGHGVIFELFSTDPDSFPGKRVLTLETVNLPSRHHSLFIELLFGGLWRQGLRSLFI